MSARVIGHQASALMSYCLLSDKFTLHFRDNRLRSVSRLIGTNATFNCHVEIQNDPSSLSPITLTIYRIWYKDGNLLAPSSKNRRYRFSNDSAVLRVKALKLEDQGAYQCVVWTIDSVQNKSSNITARFELVVKEENSSPDAIKPKRELMPFEKRHTTESAGTTINQDIVESDFNAFDSSDLSEIEEDDSEESEENEDSIDAEAIEMEKKALRLPIEG